MRLRNVIGSAPALFGALVGAAAAIVALIILFSPGRGVGQGAEAVDAAPGEVVAILESAQDADAFLKLALAKGYRLIERDDLSGLDLHMIALSLPERIAPADAIEELEGAAPYSVVGVNHTYTFAEKAQPRLFARAAIGWSKVPCAASARLGLIDAPVDAERIGLAPGGLTAANFLRAGEPISDVDHGAAIAGILTGREGLLAKAQLFSGEAVTTDRSGRAFSRVDHMARAIDWMAESGVQVVNISLAGPRNKILAKVVQSAVRRGMILVAAAGNSGPHAEPQYPAAFQGVIAVTAVDAARQVYRDANQGAHIDIAAPGVDIWLFGAERGRYASGTSLAAPYVAARLALAIANGEASDVASARALLQREAEDLGEAGRDPVFGAGLLRFSGAC